MNGELKDGDLVETLNEKGKINRIQSWIRYADERLRRKYFFLKYQNTLGLAITLSSALGMIGMGILYIVDLIPWWICIPVSAFLASLLHEIEHDLIHNQYFKNNLRVQNFMFWIVWLFRANTVNPWYRKQLHLLHHRVSGNKEDAEERFIGNGMQFGIKRLLTMIDTHLALKFQGPKIGRDAFRELRKIGSPLKKGPFREIFHLFWYAFLIWGAISIVNSFLPSPIHGPTWMDTTHNVLNTIAVIYLIPCWLRQTAIQVVSSNMHYYGDIETVHQQTQVLDSWLILPLHLFCFNFGATHGMHHYVVSQPFYLRQAVFPFVRPALRKYGVRFNDFGSMLRANSRLAK